MTAFAQADNAVIEKHKDKQLGVFKARKNNENT